MAEDNDSKKSFIDFFSNISIVASDFTDSVKKTEEDLNKTVFGSSTENKVLRETSPDTVSIMEYISQVRTSPARLKEKQEKAGKNWINMDEVMEVKKNVVKNFDPYNKMNNLKKKRQQPE